MNSDCEADTNFSNCVENLYENSEERSIEFDLEKSNLSDNIENKNESRKIDEEMENNNSSFKSHEVYEVPSPELPKEEPKTSRGKAEPQKSSGTSCEVCSKTVYPMEQILMDNKIYHKLCFRCCKCQKALSPTVVSKMNGNLFCKPHYIELFKKRGRYDDIDVSKQSPNQDTSTHGSSFPTAATSHQSYEKTTNNSPKISWRHGIPTIWYKFILENL